jgi:hypothetical protein
LLPLALAGCASSSPGTISGTVKLNGKPIEGGTVIFFCNNGKEPIRAAIEADGTYKISSAPPGPATIVVMGQEPPPILLNAGMEGGAPVPKDSAKKIGGRPAPPPVKRVWVPARYQTLETSDLRYTVEPGEQQHDIALTGTTDK